MAEALHCLTLTSLEMVVTSPYSSKPQLKNSMKIIRRLYFAVHLFIQALTLPKSHKRTNYYYNKRRTRFLTGVGVCSGQNRAFGENDIQT